MKLIIEGRTYIYDVISVEEEINEIYNHNIRNSSQEIRIDCSNDFSYFKNLYDSIWSNHGSAKTLYKKDYVIQGHFLDTRNDNIFKMLNMTLRSISVDGNSNKYSVVLSVDFIELIGLNKDLKIFSKNYLKSAKTINKFNL